MTDFGAINPSSYTDTPDLIPVARGPALVHNQADDPLRVGTTGSKRKDTKAKQQSSYRLSGKTVVAFAVTAGLVSSYLLLAAAPTLAGVTAVSLAGTAAVNTYCTLKDWSAKSGLRRAFARAAGATFRRRMTSAVLVGGLAFAMTGLAAFGIDNAAGIDKLAGKAFTSEIIGRLADGKVVAGKTAYLSVGPTEMPVVCTNIGITPEQAGSLRFTCNMQQPDGSTAVIVSDRFSKGALSVAKAGNQITVTPNDREAFANIAFHTERKSIKADDAALGKRLQTEYKEKPNPKAWFFDTIAKTKKLVKDVGKLLGLRAKTSSPKNHL